MMPILLSVLAVLFVVFGFLMMAVMPPALQEVGLLVGWLIAAVLFCTACVIAELRDLIRTVSASNGR